MGSHPQLGDVGSLTVGPVNVIEFLVRNNEDGQLVDSWFKYTRAHDRVRQEHIRLAADLHGLEGESTTGVH